jgi:hypothetical protein
MKIEKNGKLQPTDKTEEEVIKALLRNQPNQVEVEKETRPKNGKVSPAFLRFLESEKKKDKRNVDKVEVKKEKEYWEMTNEELEKIHGQKAKELEAYYQKFDLKKGQKNTK